MKMTTGKKRLVAVLLAVLMVFSIIPFAAMAVNAATAYLPAPSTTPSVSGTYASGSKIPVTNGTLAPTIGTATTGITVGGNVYRATLVEYNIDGVYASDTHTSYIPAGSTIPSAQGVSVYANTSTEANYATSVKNEMNAKMAEAAGNAGSYTAVTNFYSSVRNKLDTITINAGSNTIKTVYLYAKITSYYKESSGANMSGTIGQESNYYYIGSVTVQPSALTLTATLGSNIGNSSMLLYTSVSGGDGYTLEYEVIPKYAYGITIAPVSGQTGTYRITTSGYQTTGNELTVNVYATDTSGSTRLYYYRDSSGTTIKSATKPTGRGGQYVTTQDPVTKVYATPLMDSKTVSMSNYTNPITSIQFAKPYYTCEVGDSFYVSATALPVGASGGITFVSNNPSIVTVTSSGAVTALSEGTAVITAQASNSAVTATTVIMVSKMTAKLTLDKSYVSMPQGEQATLTATLLPETLTNKTVYWTTSDPTVAMVSNGVITGLKEGTATITATYAANSNKKAYCYVTVTKQVAKISVKEAMSVKVGETVSLGASILNSTSQAMIYSSDNSAVVKVDAKGNVTGVKAGSAMITVMAAADTSIKDYCIVTVTGESGVIKETTKYVAGSNYYRSSDVSSADVKTAITQLKGAKSIDVTVDVISESDMNKVVITRYAAARLAKYADSLIVKVDDKICVFDSADLAKMSIGRPVYVYVTPDKVTVKYKNTSGVYKTIKVTPEVTEK